MLRRCCRSRQSTSGCSLCVSRLEQLLHFALADRTIATSQALDDRLVRVLTEKDIRLLRVEWLLAQPKGYKIQRRQDLEELERADQELSPLLTGEEAAALIRNGAREVGALSYGWLLPWDPDPTGERMVLLRRVLLERPGIKALFWDQATLYQLPRDEKEDLAFSRSLHVMMDLYASAIGTTCAAAPLPFPSTHQTILSLAPTLCVSQSAPDQGHPAPPRRV
jgi:hypothetical protein